ncbi:hypothetical protein [Glutamicibacter arilaitensis]|uniref:hypothetical protein n=1 Tax=Glutamicibacter arilaitensis TaxID=256701 RepID=UPI003FD5AE5E
MSNLPGNPFAVMANDALGCTPINAEDQLNLNTYATSNATLALAYEQRTANLIAFLSHADSDQYEAIWREMNERLGLGENK